MKRSRPAVDQLSDGLGDEERVGLLLQLVPAVAAEAPVKVILDRGAILNIEPSRREEERDCSSIEDDLDRRFGRHRGHKLKKETTRSSSPRPFAELVLRRAAAFICSDTFLTIKTMRGLRELLLDAGEVSVTDLPDSFDETSQPMVVLDLVAGEHAEHAVIRGARVSRPGWRRHRTSHGGCGRSTPPTSTAPRSAPPCGHRRDDDRQERLVRAVIEPDGTIEEPYDSSSSTARSHSRASLRGRAWASSHPSCGRALSNGNGEARPARRPGPRSRDAGAHRASPTPTTAPTTRPSWRIYSSPPTSSYWRDAGDAVVTFKRDGPWYLHGVGGRPWFGREGITWQLVAPRINARYLPPGFILDSGAPCAFLKEGVPRRELFVVLGWLQTALATRLLKQVINHTRNVQGKDVERLPYPHWVPPDRLDDVAVMVEHEVMRAMNGRPVAPEIAGRLAAVFEPAAAQAA